MPFSIAVSPASAIGATWPPAFDYARLEQREYVVGWILACCPAATDHEALLTTSRQALERYLSGEPQAFVLATVLPLIMGWAHGMGWLRQDGIDARMYGSDASDVVLMRWEIGRCEALETQAPSACDTAHVWASCRTARAPSAGQIQGTRDDEHAAS